MKPPVSLKTFIGNSRAVEILRRALEQDRLPHAMIFAGPEGVGKCTLALLLAQALNCLSPVEGTACGRCSACERIMAVIQGRYLQCLTLKGDGFCGNCENCKIKIKRHPDIWLIEPAKTTITIEQVRNLISEIAFQPLEARYRVVILDPADQMRLEAHNSLLKTLEEPASRTFIILVTSNPYVLPETIRSRSRMLHLNEIPTDRIERHLIEIEGKSAEEARMAAALSGGSLSAALAFNVKEYQELRRQALDFVKLLLNRGSFAEATAIATQVAKEKPVFQRWIETVLVLLQDIYYVSIAPARVGQQDLLEELKPLSEAVPRSALVSTIKATERLRGELRFNVNRQIALEAMFLTLTQNRQL